MKGKESHLRKANHIPMHLNAAYRSMPSMAVSCSFKKSLKVILLGKAMAAVGTPCLSMRRRAPWEKIRTPQTIFKMAMAAGSNFLRKIKKNAIVKNAMSGTVEIPARSSRSAALGGSLRGKRTPMCRV